MHSRDLILRCYAEKDGDSWFAICLDLNLYARAETFEECRGRLRAVIADYVTEAVTRDAAHIDDLVPRRAPLVFYLKYFSVQLRQGLSQRLHIARDAAHTLFKETLPLIPLH